MPDDTKDSPQNPSGNSSEAPPEGELEFLEGENPTERGASDGPDSGSEVQPAPGAIQFTNPLLKDKTPEEIERLFHAQQETVRTQNQELNQYHERLRAAEQQRTPGVTETEPEPDYGDTFVSPQFRVLENRVKRMMEEAIAPLRQQVTSGAAESAREKIRKELPSFGNLEPIIDQALRNGGINPGEASETQLRQMYYTAYGLAASRGIKLDGGDVATSEPTTRKEEPVNIPQRRPSSSPLPKAPDAPKRPLTENERRLMTEMGMTEEQWHKEMNLEVDEVVQPGFSKENW